MDEKERRKYIEEAKRKIQEEREKLLREAPKLTAQLLQGPALSEEMVVRLKSGKLAKVEVHALSEGEVLEALAENPNLNLQNLTIRDYDTIIKLAAKATGFSEEDLKKGLAFGESAKIVNKAFQLSGYGQEAELETFRESEQHWASLGVSDH